jgi:hypothetical protein
MSDFKKVGEETKKAVEKISPDKLTIEVKKHSHPESAFVAEFRHIAMAKNMLLCPIPDPKGNYEWQNYRPFDFVLVTKSNVFCIEAKVEKNDLLSHQKGTAESIENLNPTAYWIIRKRTVAKRDLGDLKRDIIYTVEKYRNGKKEVICESRILSQIVEHFELVKGWGR